MSRYRWPLVALLLVLAMIVAFLTEGSESSGPSVLSPSASGWLGARAYLEARGRATTIWDEPSSAAPGGVFVTAFPWESSLAEPEEEIRGRVARGGDLLLAYSGRKSQYAETRMFGLFGIHFLDARGEPPLDPRAWYRFRTQLWHLRPDASLPSGTGDVVLGAPRRVPQAPAGASPFFRAPDGSPAIFLYRFGRGRVLVLPADALSNARLSEAGNADLLESLGRLFPGRIVFDEYHHGLTSPEKAAAGSAFPLDLLIAQLSLLYALGVLALSRRLGRPWRETPVSSGSTASFLMGLAARHRALGHFPEAARLLVSRVARLDPSFPATADPRAAEFADEKTLLSLAAALSRRGKEIVI